MQSESVAGRYEIIGPLGVGGFARILLARDLEQQRDVALKVLRPQTAPDWKASGRSLPSSGVPLFVVAAATECS